MFVSLRRGSREVQVRDVVIETPKSRNTEGGKVQPSLLPRENSSDPVKIFTLTPNGV